MARLGGLPLPEAVAMTPPRGETGSNMTQQWTPVQYPNEAPVQDREPPATATRPVARQAVLLPATGGEAARGSAMEAAMKQMLDTGGEELLQLSSGWYRCSRTVSDLHLIWT
jgi:hypothetical protein